MSCLRPKLVRVNGEIMTVPCGRCPSCCFNKTASWTFRLLQQDRVSSISYFITLTYDADHLVTTPFNQASLCKYDFQCFLKRLRKRKSGSRVSDIKYYGVGEYGGKTKRPHYHAIIFNASDELIDSAWDKGNIVFGDVNDNSIGYTLKYLNKRSTIGLFGDDDRHPMFRCSSQGLGISYLDKRNVDWHLADFWNRNFLELPSGAKIPMPRYYYEKIYDGYQRDLLKMSGSLIRQDKFFQEFISTPFEKRMQANALFEKRVEAAILRHEYNNSKSLIL